MEGTFWKFKLALLLLTLHRFNMLEPFRVMDRSIANQGQSFKYNSARFSKIKLASLFLADRLISKVCFVVGVLCVHLF